MKLNEILEQYRLKDHRILASQTGSSCGFFRVPYGEATLSVMISDGSVDGWEHVSISLIDRCPTWEEMCYIKSLCWDDNEAVVQYHVKKEDHINNHPYCLHMWRNIDKPIETPPSYMVGIKGKNLEDLKDLKIDDFVTLIKAMAKYQEEGRQKKLDTED